MFLSRRPIKITAATALACVMVSATTPALTQSEPVVSSYLARPSETTLTITDQNFGTTPASLRQLGIYPQKGNPGRR